MRCGCRSAPASIRANADGQQQGMTLDAAAPSATTFPASSAIRRRPGRCGRKARARSAITTWRSRCCCGATARMGTAIGNHLKNEPSDPHQKARACSAHAGNPPPAATPTLRSRSPTIPARPWRCWCRPAVRSGAPSARATSACCAKPASTNITSHTPRLPHRRRGSDAPTKPSDGNRPLILLGAQRRARIDHSGVRGGDRGSGAGCVFMGRS